MNPKDFTLPAASESAVQLTLERPKPFSSPPQPAHPTRWQQVLLFIRSVLTWWMEWIDHQLEL